MCVNIYNNIIPLIIYILIFIVSYRHLELPERPKHFNFCLKGKRKGRFWPLKVFILDRIKYFYFR